ncbi:fumarylacetoacetate hydrolase family protein [Massilia sp. S19_KUP03_FR1]|uniref:fumarylacetoacetate hydrolase family protein n=1 Tax=Massilia sp. S19_KUP03_FR1 TaxID=3025503 RepID=UPI002FCD4EF1
MAQARFLSPIPRPDRNIYCVVWNYLDHFEEGKNARVDKVVDKLPDHLVFFTKGKSLDGHGPMGPWIVSAAGVKLDDVRVICRVNGVEKQNGSYQQMYFKIPRIIAELSRGMTLEPGDIIATGTPSGVGFARKPQEFLKDGDVMETEITGVGVIRNTIRAKT